MHAIKFRGWHRKDQKMYSPDALKEQGYFIDLNIKGFVRFENNSSTKPTYSTTMLPLLGSCRKDKNGVEIFEGDILRYKDKVYQVLWYDTGIWMIQDDGKPLDLTSFASESEIIGDLYTNPDRINDRPREALKHSPLGNQTL